MVLVGTIEFRFRRMIMFHMAAEDLNELHEMADKIGINRKWFQCENEKHPHYDICKSKKALALKFGAVEVNDREIVRMHQRVFGFLEGFPIDGDDLKPVDKNEPNQLTLF